MKIRKLLKFTIFTIIILIFNISYLLSAIPAPWKKDKLTVVCPENMAVLHILVIISSPENLQTKMFTHPLAHKAQEYFSACKDHPAVFITGNLYQQMWYFPLNYLAFHYSRFPQAEQIHPFPSEFDIDDTMRTLLTNYVNQVNDFYITSNFKQFWEEHSDEIETIIENVRNDFPEIDLPRMMEKFYGREIEKFYLVPCPFMTNSGTHVEVNKNGKWNFYHLAGPDLFSDPFTNIYTAFHEFSHSFIEPVSREYSSQINKLAYLYKPLQQEFSRMGYRNWDRAFNEHMVTAAQLHFTGMAFGDERKDKMLDMERNKGFKLIERFYNYFQDYKENRDRFNSLRDYYPILLQALSTIQIDSFRTAGPLGIYPEYHEDGCYIKDVVTGSAMEQAGIQKGDILAAIKDIEITSQNKLKKAKDKYWNQAEEGDQVKITIKRNGEIISKSVSVLFEIRYEFLQ